MNEFLRLHAFVGLLYGSAYAIAASGLVLTYTTTRVFNIAHGAVGMLMAFIFWQLTVPEHMNRLLALLLILFVIAPALGVLIERVAARNLRQQTDQRQPRRHHRVVRADHRHHAVLLGPQRWPLGGAVLQRRLLHLRHVPADLSLRQASPSCLSVGDRRWRCTSCSIAAG